MGVSTETLRRWEKAGKLNVADRTPGGQRLYELADLYNLKTRRPESLPGQKITLGYARVSTAEQKEDLARQVALLETYCRANAWPCEVISDVGSGLNYRKKGLRGLIRKICQQEVTRLVLTDQDRLLRFGSELVFALCAQFGVEVVIINATLNNNTPEEDLAADVLEILTVFAARLYGARSRRNKVLLARLQAEVTATAHV
jgi:predicted site-specific integrase-resolvase